MANKDNNSDTDFVNVIHQHKNNSSSLSFLHQQNMDLSPTKSVDASNTTSPPQASSTAETPISPSSTQSVAKPVMTSSDKVISSSPHDSGGRNQLATQQNSNSSVYHPDTTSTNNINNNINNNNSQNIETNHNNDALNKSGRFQDNQEDGPLFRSNHLVTPDNNDHQLSKKSPSHESHFSGGSGILADTPPKRPERRQYVNKSRTELNNILKEREERVKRVRQEQEAERIRKAEEWKQQALAAHKFREQQEYERKRALEEARNREIAKQNQIKERREKIMESERQRREELLKRNMAREERLEQRRKSQANQIHFGFGSSTPRMIEPRLDDGYRRSTSSSNVHGQMTQSLYVPSRRSADRDSTDEGGRFSSASGGRHSTSTSERQNKRSTSVYGLDKSGKEGNEGDDLMTKSFHAGATPSQARPNRRRTDITPTITPHGMGTGMGNPFSSREISRASTPGRRMMMSATNGKSPGKAVSMSRLDQLARPRVLNLNQSKATTPSEISPSHAPLSLTTNARLNHRRGRLEQSPSKKISASMSHLSGPSFNGTPAPKTRQRTRPPLSASASMRTRSKTGSIDEEVNTPDTKKKGPGSVGRGGGMDDPNDDTKSNASSSSSNKAQVRRTPAQVKAADAKKAKPIKSPKDASLNPPVSTPNKKPSVISNNKPNCNVTNDNKSPKEDHASESEQKKPIETPETNTDETTKVHKREKTPDIISGAVIQRPKDSMEPQIMVNEEDSSNHKNEEESTDVKETTDKRASEEKSADEGQDNGTKPEMKDDDHEQTPSKHIISSEEEAKARLAEKRRLMKEKMEREAELERQRQAEIERIEEEKRLREEEEERRAIEEAEKLAAEARKVEEERLQKAIEEAQKREAEERAKRDEEERIKKEAEQRAKEEAERKQAELEEKLKKEEEERLARKKRIEEIMARTRGGNKASTASPAGTPKKESSPKSGEDFNSSETENVNDTTDDNKTASNEAQKEDHDNKTNESNNTDLLINTTNNNNEPLGQSKEEVNESETLTTNGILSSPVTNGQEVNKSFVNNGTPDLLGNLSYDDNKLLIDTQKPLDANHQEEKMMNEKNASQNFSQQQQPLLDFGNDVDPFDTKISNAATAGGSMLGNDPPVFDQIIDLSSEENIDSLTINKNNLNLNPSDNNSGGKEENSVIGAPIIAFEDSITASTKSDVPSTADLLS